MSPERPSREGGETGSGLDRRTLLRGATGLLLGGAGLAVGGSHAAPPEAATPAATPVAVVPTATPVPPAPSRGGTARMAAVEEPDSLHPWQARSAIAADLLDGVYDGLLRFNADGRLQPALAESFAIADDGLTYTFALRKGALYHNGEPFGGEDVVATWQALADASVGAALTGWDRVVEVVSPRPALVEFRLAAPYAPFLATVATTPILPAGVLQSGDPDLAANLARWPVGTGPFRVMGWEAGKQIDLERHAGWWGGEAPLDGIRVRFVADRAAAARAVRKGDADLVSGGGALGPGTDPVGLLDGVDLLRHPTRTWHHIDLKQVGFLRESGVRQALDLAIPRDAIFGDLLGGRGIPAFADQPPSSWAYAADLAPRSHDPAEAARLLDAAGLRLNREGVRERDDEPFFLEVWSVAGDPVAESIASAVATAWRDLGVVAVPRTGDPGALWGPLGYQFSDRMTACLYAWTNGNDPDDLYYWHASQIPKSPWGSGGNLPAFFHRYAFQADIDALIEEGAAAGSLEQRTRVYRDIQTLLAKEVPALFLFWEEAFPAVASRLRGPRPSAHTGLLWNAGTWSLG